MKRGGLPLRLRVLGRQRRQVVPYKYQILKTASVSNSSVNISRFMFPVGQTMWCAPHMCRHACSSPTCVGAADGRSDCAAPVQHDLEVAAVEEALGHAQPLQDPGQVLDLPELRIWLQSMSTVNLFAMSITSGM